LIDAYLWAACQISPDFTLDEYRKMLLEFRFDVSITTISKTFKKWRWNLKVPSRFQIQKYASENIIYYGIYLLQISEIPWGRLKFLDEGHFVSRFLFRKKARSLIGQRIHLITSNKLSLSYSLTIMTQLSQSNPVIFDVRNNSNNQWNFLNFIVYCLDQKHLVEGDILIMDNASIHGSDDSFEILHDILEIAKVKLYFLPTYSPELNPCELVFSKLKHHFYYYRDDFLDFEIEILRAFAKISVVDILSFYHHCISC
jgi:transposase